MTKDFKNFLDLQAKMMNILPEDMDYYYEIHENKPLTPELQALFGDEMRISIPIEISAGNDWEGKFKRLFSAFVDHYGKKIDFVNWQVEVDKNKLKLTKALVAFYCGDYTPELFEIFKETGGEHFKWILDNKPSKKAEKVLVLSRDPQDFYMASTNQPQTSCIGLERPYGKWEGVMNAVADPFRLMAYIPDGGKTEFEVKKYDDAIYKYEPFKLTSDRFIGRSWAIYDVKANGLYYPRWFGTSPKMISEIKYGNITAVSSIGTSKPFRAIRCFSNITIPTVYFDNMSVKKKTDQTLSNIPGGSGSIESAGIKNHFIGVLRGVRRA